MSEYSEIFTSQINLEDPNSTHAQVLNAVGHNKRVLEVGCSSGYLLEVLRASFGCEVYGLELDEADAAKAKEITSQITVGNIETADLSDIYQREFFDTVVFADVLEHLNDPAAVLRKVKPFVKSELVISVPNIAHSAVIYQLISGKFNYANTGLLDRTHRHFFTKETLEKMLADCGYLVSYIKEIKVSAANTEINNNLAVIPAEIRNYLESLPHAEHYQYVLKAVPADKPALKVISQLAENKKALEDSQRRCLELENKLSEELAAAEQRHSQSDRQLQWYQAKLKEVLQVNAKSAHRICDAGQELERAHKYNADNYPKIIAAPVKFLMAGYRTGYTNTAKYWLARRRGTKSAD